MKNRVKNCLRSSDTVTTEETILQVVSIKDCQENEETKFEKKSPAVHC